jgi:radical SAM protein with 4Fe4S-binding SPASM domain
MSKSYRRSPTLNGYNYSIDDAHDARRNGKLLAMRTELSKYCNYKCLYCNEGSDVNGKELITYEEVASVIDQVRELGGQSVIVIGGGEPMLYPEFMRVIKYINSCKMVPVVFTNGSSLNKDTIKYLYDMNTSIILKMDSLKEDVQDYLAGKRGAFRSINKAMNLLLASEYVSNSMDMVKIGVSFVSTKYNIQEIPDIWRFCRSQKIYPNHELLIMRGRARIGDINLEPSKNDVMKLKKRLREIDNNEYGYDWLEYTPLTGYGCLQMYYSVYLTVKGYVRPCADIDIELFNIRDMTIKEIINTEFFNVIRNIDNHLVGKCGKCEYNYECVGCRGAAYARNIERNENHYDAVISEDPTCWREDKLL